jgi:hypothetical protein
VTSCNVAFQLAQKSNVAYLDFDFGSPTSGAIFEIPGVERGVDDDGLHSYFTQDTTDPAHFDVWRHTSRRDLRGVGVRAARLAFFPGDRGGAEFATSVEIEERCVELFVRLNGEFEVIVVDLSAGRSHALNMVLKATAAPALREIAARWLVFHRWTRQHILAANGLVHGSRGLLDVGENAGHDRAKLRESIRFVRVAVPNLKEFNLRQTAAQSSWLLACDEELRRLAGENKLGWGQVLGTTPVEPMLQWREQIIAGVDVSNRIADPATVGAFQGLANGLIDQAIWETK